MWQTSMFPAKHGFSNINSNLCCKRENTVRNITQKGSKTVNEQVYIVKNVRWLLILIEERDVFAKTKIVFVNIYFKFVNQQNLQNDSRSKLLNKCIFLYNFINTCIRNPQV